MPDHERKQIRDAIVARLTGETAAGTRVFTSRIAPIRVAQLPAISVYTDSETVDAASLKTFPRELTRTVTVAIEGWVRVTDGVDDALDALALEIETAMDGDNYLSATCGDSMLISTEFGMKLDGDREMGAVRLEYTATYRTDPRIDALGDNFDTMGVEYNLENDQHEDDSADDLVDEIYQGA